MPTAQSASSTYRKAGGREERGVVAGGENTPRGERERELNKEGKRKKRDRDENKAGKRNESEENNCGGRGRRNAAIGSVGVRR